MLKLGLQVTQDSSSKAVPSLSPLYLSAADPDCMSRLVSSLRHTLTDDAYLLKDSHDTFRVEGLTTSSPFNSMGELKESLSDTGSSNNEEEGIVDYEAIVKSLVICDCIPSPKLTSCFNHHAFYSNLSHYQSRSREGASRFGSVLIYAEVITSTNSILEK